MLGLTGVLRQAAFTIARDSSLQLMHLHKPRGQLDLGITPGRVPLAHHEYGEECLSARAATFCVPRL